MSSSSVSAQFADLDREVQEATETGFYWDRVAKRVDRLLEEVDLGELQAKLESVEGMIKEYYRTCPDLIDHSLFYHMVKAAPATAYKLVKGMTLSTMDSENGYGERPLHLAAARAYTALVVALIDDQGADVNGLMRPGGMSSPKTLSPAGRCIHEAYGSIGGDQQRAKETFEALVARGADLNARGQCLEPLLSECLGNEATASWAEVFFRPGAVVDYNQKGQYDRTALHHATHRGDAGLVRQLVRRGADPHAVCYQMDCPIAGFTATHIAVDRRPEVMAALLEGGADPYRPIDNPDYGKQEAAGKVEPLSAYAVAVDRGRAAHLDVICALRPPKPEDLQMPVNRSRFDHSTDLRLELQAEAAKRAFRVTIPGDVICSTNQEKFCEALRPFIENTFAPRKFGGAQRVFEGIWGVILAHVRENPAFGLYCFAPEDLKDSSGEYNANSKNEVVVALSIEEFRYHFLDILAHELTHKVADLLYPDMLCAPPRGSRFHQALKADLARIQERPEACHPRIKALFAEVPRYYPNEETHPGEYLARISQAAARNASLSQEEAERVLEESIPALWAFYKEEFLPACQRYEEGVR